MKYPLTLLMTSPLPLILIQNNDATPYTRLTMNPLAPPCQSLSEYASEAVRDKALRKKKGL